MTDHFGFAASPLSTDLTQSTALGRSRSEMHALCFLARYPNPRTRAGYGITLKQFFTWCTQLDIEPLEATRNHIELFTRDLEMHGRKAPTIAAKLNALAGFYKYARIDGLITDDPMIHVTRPRVPRVSTTLGLSRPEFADMVRASNDYPAQDQTILLLLGYNGLRVSEVYGLNVEDIGRHQGQPIVQILRKGGKRQHVPLAPRTAWQLELAIGDRIEGPAFVTRGGRRIDRRVVGRIVTRACIDAGISKRVTPHSLRHTFVTLSLDAGRSERDVAASVGHADTRLVSYYDRGRDSIVRNTTHSVASLIEGSL